MKRTKVKSSNIESIGWENNVLEIKFLGEIAKDGTFFVYRYAKVPEKVFNAMMKAKSQGKFFHANIKDEYEFKKVKMHLKKGK